VPGPVEVLLLETCLHNIKVHWISPRLYSNCVTDYVIDWLQIQNGKKESSIVSWRADSFVIVDLEANEEYEVSVRAVNEKGYSSRAVTEKTKTETNGK
jgi:hypothetical protein